MGKGRAEVLVVVLIGAVSVVALSSVGARALGMGACFPVKSAAVFLTIGTLLVVRRDTHPFPRLGPANLVTIVRAGIVSMVAAAIGETLAAAAAVAIVSASLVTTALDGVGGSVARRSGMASPYGARFDMELDAFLILVLSILTWQSGRVGAWILLAGLLRYLFLGAGWLLPWMRQPLPPSVRRQTVCVLQIAGLLLALTPVVSHADAVTFAAVSLAALVCSFVADTWWLRRSDR